MNVGNPKEMTIKEFAEAILRKTGTSASIEFRDLPEDDPRVRQPDISKARQLLGWEPVVDFDVGIEQTIAYFREFLGKGES